MSTNPPRPRLTLALGLLLLTTPASAAEVPPFARTGDLYVLVESGDSIVRVTPKGEVFLFVSEDQLEDIVGNSNVNFGTDSIALDEAGNVYFTMSTSKKNHVYRASPDGEVEIFVHREELESALGRLSQFDALALGSNGNIFLSQRNGPNTILEVDSTTGAVSVLTDIHLQGGSSIANMASEPNGEFVFVDASNPDRLIKMAQDQSFSVLADLTGITGDDFLARAPNGDFVIAAGSPTQITRISATGETSELISNDDLRDAGINQPRGMAFDGQGNLFIAENGTDSIFKWDASSGMLSKFVTKEDIALVIPNARVDLAAGIAFERIAPAPPTLSIEVNEDNQSAVIGGISPKYSTMVLERSLSGEDWEPAAPAFLSTGTAVQTELAFTEDTELFRWRWNTPNFTISDHPQDGISISLDAPVPAESFLFALGERLGTFVMPCNLLDPGLTIGPLNATGLNVGEIGEKIGIPLWSPPPLDDNPLFADRFRSLPAPPNPSPDPIDVGTGVMEDGWASDNPNLGDPDQPEIPAPGEFEMPWDPSQPIRTSDPYLEAVEELQGEYAQIVITLKSDGSVLLDEAFSLPGSALREHFSPLPSTGGLVLAVRSLTQTEHGGIYHLDGIPDPLEVRSYDHPSGDGSHGAERAEEVELRLKVPLLPGENLDDIEVDFYRHSTQAPFDTLDPALLAPALGQLFFTKLGTVTGKDIMTSASNNKEAPRKGSAARDAVVSTVFESGPTGQKINIAILGDGFAETAADQALFDNWVTTHVVDGLFGINVPREVRSAFNVYKVSTFSADSGVTMTDVAADNYDGIQSDPADPDDRPSPTRVNKDTALGYTYNGNWNKCWISPGPKSARRRALRDVPQADYIFVVLNTFWDPDGDGLRDRLGDGLDDPIDLDGDGEIDPHIPLPRGGCARGKRFEATVNVWPDTVRHEFGHSFVDLGDEYSCDSGPDCRIYSRSTSARINHEGNRIERGTRPKWDVWVPSWRPLPTTPAMIGDPTQDVAAFAGATKGQTRYRAGLYRPSLRSIMNNNNTAPGPPHHPVGYTRFRETALPFQDGDFRQSVAADFDGDGRTDLLLQDSNQLLVYNAGPRRVGPDDPLLDPPGPPRPETAALKFSWDALDSLEPVPESAAWRIRSSDQLLPARFDPSEGSDLYAINYDTWSSSAGSGRFFLGMLRSYSVISGESSTTRFRTAKVYRGVLPGWAEMRANDQYYVGDWDGDDRDDLMVVNLHDWPRPYVLLLRNTGAQLEALTRYDGGLPFTPLRDNHKFIIADVDGDGKDDVISHNTNDYSHPFLTVHTSTGAGLALKDAHYRTIAGWTMRRSDQIIPLDYNGDDRKDLAIFNGHDWSGAYLQLLQADPSGRYIAEGPRYVNLPENPHITNWPLMPNDRFVAADVNGNGLEDLVAFNASDWGFRKNLGVLLANPDGHFTGHRQEGAIGAWQLEAGDRFVRCEFQGGAGWDDLFVIRRNALGLLRGQRTNFGLEVIYPKWIKNHRFHRLGWW